MSGLWFLTYLGYGVMEKSAVFLATLRSFCILLRFRSLSAPNLTVFLSTIITKSRVNTEGRAV
jgi:hypothetical protein